MNIETIYYKPIEGCDGYYVTNNGMVLSIKNGCWRVMKQNTNNCGYKRICLCNNNIKKGYFVHRLVAQAFIPNPNNLPQVNHINENKSDNRVENLEWVTRSKNARHGTAIQRSVEKKSKKINQYTLDGTLVKTWLNAHEVKRQLHFSQGNISACCRGVRKTAYGFKWSFAS